MSKQARRLRALRAWLGLTEKDVAMKCGTSYSGFYKSGSYKRDESTLDSTLYECGRSLESGLNYDGAYNVTCDAVSEKYAEKSRAAIARTFTVGSCYQVVSNKSQIERLKAGEKYVLQSISASINDPESGYTFRYLGKQGIHHAFKEISGGWGRTYTDAQLVGKELVEVSEDDVAALRESPIMQTIFV